MDPKFKVGDKVVFVIPPHRKVNPTFMRRMENYIGECATVLDVRHAPWSRDEFPKCSYSVSIFGGAQYFFEDWLELTSETEVSFDKEQLTSLL